MGDNPSHDEMTQQQLTLLDQLRGNQRRIYVGLAIAVVCTGLRSATPVRAEAASFCSPPRWVD